MNKKKYLIVIILFISLIAITLDTNYIFGNTSNYFIEKNIINLFKESYLTTHKIIPSPLYFTNIFKFAKYGFLNPLVILYYFIKTPKYLEIISIISISISIILLFKLYKDNKLSLITIIILIINSSIVLMMFSSINEILTIPYILLSYIGLKKRIEDNNIFILTISIFLISISNYTYLIPIIIYLFIYSTYSYLKKNNTIITFKYLKHIVNTLIPILCGLLLSSFFIINILNNTYNIKNIISINYNYSFIIIICFITGLLSSKENIFLSIIMFISITLFSNFYLVFLPLLGILINTSLKELLNKNINYKLLIICIIFSIIYSIYIKNNIMLLELLIFYISLFLYKDNKRLIYFILPLTIYLYIFNLNTLLKQDYISKNLYIDNISNKEDILTSKIHNAFASNNLISTDEYTKLNSLEKKESLLKGIIIDSKGNNNYISNVKSLNIPSDNYYLDIKDNTTYEQKIEENNFIYIEFNAKSDNCSNSYIKINNIVNKIKCTKQKYTYLIDNNTNLVYTVISKGNYIIDNIKIYTLDKAILDNNNYIDIYDFNKETINVSNDGYFMYKIKYNNNYEILLDNKEIPYEKVDNNYIGFPITKGKHHIKIKYKTKNKIIGYFFTYLGLFFTYVIYYYERKRKFM